MSEEIPRRPNGAYLIESAPNRRQYLAAKYAREVVERITAPLDEFIAGYKSELDHALNADAVYLGTGK